MLGAVSEQDGRVFLTAIKVLEFFKFLYSVFAFCCSRLTMGVHVTRKVLEEILRLKLEPIDPSMVSGRHIDWEANKTWLLRNAPYISFQNRMQFATLE